MTVLAGNRVRQSHRRGSGSASPQHWPSRWLLAFARAAGPPSGGARATGLQGQACQIVRSSLGFQKGRKSSILGQRFMTTFNPAFSASSAALSS